jgi:heterotetrameric sarcosine oxidase gamma subunit
MSFEFLAPDAALSADGSRPALRSPIEWEHRDAGAEFGERAGWRFVTGYGASEEEAAACRESVGVADLAHLGKIELQGEPALVSSIVARLAGGAALELGQAALNDEVWWCPITAGRVLAVTPPETTAQVRDELEAAADDGGSLASVTELTAAYGSNAVLGPLARETFARATALDMRPDRFPVGAFAPVSVARTAGMVLCEGEDRYLHLFGAGFAHYVWTVFVDAAAELGGRAVGAEALGASPREGVAARA